MRVANTSTGLLEPKIIRLFIGFGIEQVILLHGNPVEEAAVLPNVLVEGLTLHGRVIKSIAPPTIVNEADIISLPVPEQLWVVGLDTHLLLDSKIALMHGHGQVGSSLEDLEVAGLGPPDLRDLYARGPGTNNITALVFHVDVFLGPKRRVVYNALKFVHAGLWMNITLGSLKDSINKLLADW